MTNLVSNAAINMKIAKNIKTICNTVDIKKIPDKVKSTQRIFLGCFDKSYKVMTFNEVLICFSLARQYVLQLPN